jgi:hypothetical protein
MNFAKCIVSVVRLLSMPGLTLAQTPSLQDIGGQVNPGQLPEVVIYRAREIVTLDPAKPTTEAVAVVGDRILTTGTLAQLKAAAGDQKYSVDETFSNKVLVPGFIAQHDHPILTPLTMVSEILAIEDWTLLGGTIHGVKDKADFFQTTYCCRKTLARSTGDACELGLPPKFLWQTNSHLT